jgi:hypothetical protein
MSTAAATPCFHSVVHQDGEQMAVQFIHGVVFVANLRRLIGIPGQHSILSTVAQFDGEAAHFGEVTDNFFRQGRAWVAAAGDLGDMQRQSTHPFYIGDILHRTDNCAQIAGDG